MYPVNNNTSGASIDQETFRVQIFSSGPERFTGHGADFLLGTGGINVHSQELGKNLG